MFQHYALSSYALTCALLTTATHRIPFCGTPCCVSIRTQDDTSRTASRPTARRVPFAARPIYISLSYREREIYTHISVYCYLYDDVLLVARRVAALPMQRPSASCRVAPHRVLSTASGTQQYDSIIPKVMFTHMDERQIHLSI